MINGLSSMGNYQAIASNSGSKAPPPPKDQNVFQLSDSDADGLISLSELETLTSNIEEATGNSLSATDAIKTYDANNDGGLSGEELFEMLSNSGFSPPQVGENQEGGEEMPPPPPPMDQAISAYTSNSEDNAISVLLDLLNGNDSEETYSAIDTTT